MDSHVGQWQEIALKDDEFVISAGETTRIHARREHTAQSWLPRTPKHVEHGHFRCGA
jgi:hypothetical protein